MLYIHMKYFLDKCNITIHQQCTIVLDAEEYDKNLWAGLTPLCLSETATEASSHTNTAEATRRDSEVQCKVSFTSFFQTSWAYSPFNTCTEHFPWGWASKINKHPPFLSSWCSRRSNAPWDQRPCLPCSLLCLKASHRCWHIQGTQSVLVELKN